MSESPRAATDFAALPYDFGAALAISEALDLRLPIATALVRRGLDSPDEVAALIEGEPENDPFLLSDMDSAIETIIAVARSGQRITVHGDYDADGVCATSILLEVLREIGAEADWFIPDRREGGYGVSQTSIDELVGRGTSLMITVDCGIGSREEIARLTEAGIRCVVTDHHEQPESLPDCPVVHPALGEYPFPSLCGAGVAYKLATALRSETGLETDCGVDLVALATVADLMPLTGENRTLVKRGLNRMRTSPRTGLRALMDAAGVSPDSVDAGALGFRLAPRINAAGRLYRADAGVELMLCEDPERAAEIGEELNRANSERRSVEREVMNGAEAARRQLSEEERSAPALVLAGEGWHPGVVGIVASRLVEKYWRPVILIALEGGVGRGSGRSIRGFDLLAGISAGGDLLNRFGGHKMAAGLEIDESRIAAFRKSFVAHAVDELGAEAPARTSEVDAVVGAGQGGVDMELAEQLERLEPFGMGNPRPRFLVPAAQLASVRSMGREGKHASFDLCSGSNKVKGVGFGILGQLEAIGEEAVDAEVQVEINRWNDSVEARVVAREVSPVAADGAAGHPPASAVDRSEWSRRFSDELDLGVEIPPMDGNDELPSDVRLQLDRRDSPVVSAVMDLASTGDSVLVICCDVGLRRRLAEAADPRRLRGVPMRVVGPEWQAAADGGESPVVLADWDWVAEHRQEVPGFSHVAVIDPPWDLGHLEALQGGTGKAEDPGFLHLLWHTRDLDTARTALRMRWDLRPAAVQVWRLIEAADGEMSAEEIAEAVADSQGGLILPPRCAALAVRALSEAGQVEVSRDGAEVSVRALGGEGKLEDSDTVRRCSEFLSRLTEAMEAIAVSGGDRTAQAA